LSIQKNGSVAFSKIKDVMIYSTLGKRNFSSCATPDRDSIILEESEVGSGRFEFGGVIVGFLIVYLGIEAGRL
jgi:hypothetical protein